MIHDADQLTDGEQAALAAHLLSSLKRSPLGTDDTEVALRETEIDAGTAKLITHDELSSDAGT